jgi:hypothetical protein
VADVADVALAVYKTMWEYYVQTIRNRARLLDWYFKIVALPAAAVAIVAASEAIEFPRGAVASLLLAIYVAGVAMVGAYAKMSRNSYPYYDQAQEMYGFLVETFPELEGVGSLFDKRGDRGELIGGLRLGSINAWRIASVVALNSAIGGAAVGLPTHEELGSRVWMPITLSVLASFVLHVVLYLSLHGRLVERD